MDDLGRAGERDLLEAAVRLAQRELRAVHLGDDTAVEVPVLPALQVYLGANHAGAEELSDDRLAQREPGGGEPERDVERDENACEEHEAPAEHERIVVAQGGRGGRGNARFATSTHQAPREHEEGRPGEERVFRLELKLLADVGLVGFPNVGKSTLISRISAARPKIADYPFTTLEPNLGVVVVGKEPAEKSFVVADIPGLIEGAHGGAGLGTQFLRHIERTRLLVHLVDVSDSSGRSDVVNDFEVIRGELESFGAHLEDKPMIMVASKIDVANKDKLAKLKRYAKSKGLELYPISAVTGKGVEELNYAMADRVEALQT